MFLTIKGRVADGKNNEGVAISRLSRRKAVRVRETAAAFSEAFREVTSWGMDHFAEIPFTFPGVDKDGNPILDKDGKQKILSTSAHYLANWLSTRVSLSAFDLHSKIKNGVRVKAASALISQYELRQMAEDDPERLTGPDVGEIGERRFRQEEVDSDRAEWLELLNDPELSGAEVGEVEKEIFSLDSEPRLLPVHFAGPKDFLLFKRGNGRVFVCLPMFERGSRRADRKVKRSDENRLVPLRDWEDVELPNSAQWLLLPVRFAPEQERLLADPKYTPRTCELVVKDDAFFVTVTLNAPEAPPYKPEAFLGVRVGYFQIHWALLGDDGKVRNEGAIDLTSLKEVIERGQAQHAFAMERARSDRHPRYRGVIKRLREAAVNELVALAVENRAAIGIEDVSGVDKSTKSRKANLFRSHWDFGRFVTVLTYKAILAGGPTFGRGSRRTLASTWSGVVWNAVKDLPEEERDAAGARFVAERALESFAKKLKPVSR